MARIYLPANRLTYLKKINKPRVFQNAAYLWTGLPVVCLSQACTQSAAPETKLKKKKGF